MLIQAVKRETLNLQTCAGSGFLFRFTFHVSRFTIYPLRLSGMELDTATVTRWLEPLARRPEEIAEVFTESRREVATDWRDGELREARRAGELTG